MSKKAKIWVFGGLACVLIALLVAVLVWKPWKKKIEPPPPEPPKETPIAKHNPITTNKQDEAIKRLRDKIIKGTIEITGRASDKKKGYEREANFKYTLFVHAESTDIQVKTLEDGTKIITETRKFINVSDNVVFSEAKTKLALFATLPLDKFDKVIDNVTSFFSALSPSNALNIKIGKELKNLAKSVLKKIDGRKVPEFLAAKVTDADAQKILEELLTNNSTKSQSLGALRKVAGKSYKIRYYLKGDQPVLVYAYRYVDGKEQEITDKEEKDVLQRVNVFIDYHVLPDKNCKPGKSWEIDAGNMEELFDPFVDGNYRGTVKVTRGEDDKNGFWYLEMTPSNIAIDSKGTRNGTLKLTKGEAWIDPKTYHIREMKGSGRVDLRKTSTSHLLFTSEISGECEFVSRLHMIEK